MVQSSIGCAAGVDAAAIASGEPFDLDDKCSDVTSVGDRRKAARWRDRKQRVAKTEPQSLQALALDASVSDSNAGAVSTLDASCQTGAEHRSVVTQTNLQLENDVIIRYHTRIGNYRMRIMKLKGINEELRRRMGLERDDIDLDDLFRW